MGPARMIVLAVAAVAALGLALLLHGLVGHKPPAPAPVAIAPPPVPTTQVLVAHRDLAVGVRLADGDLDWQSWPADKLDPNFITNGAAALPPTGAAAVVATGAAAAAKVVSTSGGPMQALYGSIVRTPIAANEPITETKIVRGGEGGYMAVVLDPGTRAVSVPVTVVTGSGGFILPGDRVDVLQSHPADVSGGGKPGFVVQTLLRNIKVLAIDQSVEAPKATQSMVGATATLEVQASDAEVLVEAKAQGEMILTLRAYADAGGPTGRGTSADGGEVHVYRNGQVSDVMVAP